MITEQLRRRSKLTPANAFQRGAALSAPGQRTELATRSLLQVARRISRLLDEQRLAHALTGSLPLGRYGLDRWTATVEFVVSGDAGGTVEHLGPATTVSAPGKGIAVAVDGVDVALLSVEPPLCRSDLLCTAKHAGVPVLGLEALVAVKVGTASLADVRDVIELLELGNAYVGDVTTRLSGDELDRFRALVTIVELETKRRPREARRVLVGMLAKSARL